MANTLRLEIVTPEGRAYSDDVELVTLPGVEGQLGVMPHHVHLMTRLVPGEMLVRKEGRDDYVAVGGGVIRAGDRRTSRRTVESARAAGQETVSRRRRAPERRE